VIAYRGKKRGGEEIDKNRGNTQEAARIFGRMVFRSSIEEICGIDMDVTFLLKEGM
jgi:hypothetical protein